MSLVVTYQKGEILLLQYIVGLVNAGNPVLHLFSSNTTPSYSTVIGDLTECTSSGYTPITLASSQWTTVQAAGVTTATYSEVTFSFATNASAYGYYITDTSGNLLCLERFSGAPFSIPDGGGTIGITSNITLS